MRLDAVYGAPLAGHDVVSVPGDLAGLFAAAHRRVTGRPAGAHDGTGAVVLANDPPLRPAEDVEVVAAAPGAERPIVLAGPGVVRDGAVDGLRALAAAGSLGVLNTWGAKGVFEWRSPHHVATAGLQARDFELGGLADADLIVATGVDEAEALGGWRLRPVVEIAPGDLAALATRWARPPREIEVPPLRSELARVTQEGWAVEEAPLPPTRVTLHYSEVLGADGLVVADPGVAGYWVARTYPTSAIGGAVVPAEAGRPGLAAACAVVARLVDPGRPVLCALDGRSAADAGAAQMAAGIGSQPVDEASPGAARSLRVTTADTSSVPIRAEGASPSPGASGRHDAHTNAPTTADTSSVPIRAEGASPSPGASGRHDAHTNAPTTADASGRPAEAEEATSSFGYDGRPATDPVSARVLAAGRALGATVAVEVWADRAEPLDAAAHRARLADLLATGGVVAVATDPSQLARMVEVAGPVVAWGGLSATMEGS